MVCIYIESIDVKVNKDSLDLIAISNKFKREYGFKTCGLVICNTKYQESLCELVGDLELDEIHVEHNENIFFYDEEIYTDMLYGFYEEHKPLLVLGGNTVHSKTVLARFSYRAMIGMCADCVDFWIKDNKVYTMRPIYNGTMFADICTKENQCMVCTVRKNLFEYKRETDIEPLIKVGKQSGIHQLEQIITDIVDVRNDEKKHNKIMIGIGNGIGNIDNVNKVLHIAQTLFADVGGTRMVIENSWLPKSSQIGLSGKILKDYDLYIALGISGAYQHVCGVLKCKTIIAINLDENCEMFRYSDVGIVGEVEDALNVLERVFRSEKESIKESSYGCKFDD